MKNNKKINELKNEFLKLQENEDFDFAPDNDGFLDWLAGVIEKLENNIQR